MSNELAAGGIDAQHAVDALADRVAALSERGYNWRGPENMELAE
ncbi:MAG TPA: hypothetical protein VGG77_17095 [Roseiarcus sp.]